MPRFVVGLLREAARQVRVVAVLAELALGLGEQRPRLLVGARREPRHARLLGFGEQRARLAQVLRFDGRELGVAVERFGLVGAAARAADVAGLEPAGRGVEALAGFGPELGRERRGVGVGRVGARLDDGRQRDVRDLGGVAGFRERPRGRRERAANPLHVAAAREVALGGRHRLPRRARTSRARAARHWRRAPRASAPIGFDEQRRTQILLGGCPCRERGEQASEYREPSESH